MKKNPRFALSFPFSDITQAQARNQKIFRAGEALQN